MALAGNHNFLQTLKTRFSLCVRCNKCCKKHNEISYSLNQVIHDCSEDILLIKRKRKNSVWRPVAHRPGRPRPGKYVVCQYYTKETGCKQHGSRCTFARSSEEAAIWNVMKHEKLTIPKIVNMTKQNQRTPQSKSRRKGGQFACTLCQVHFPKAEKLMNHCFTVKHRRLIFDETYQTWKYRDPPPTYKDLKLCGRSLICEYGDNCTKAHSQEELREWQKRLKASRKRARDAAEMGLLSYQDKLLEEYRHSNDKKMIVSDTLPDVSISCDTDIDSVYVRKKGIQCTWNFTIISKEPLEVIALLRRELGATFSLSKDPHEERTYSTSAWFKKNQTEYEIPVFFKSDHPGLYEQWVVFDFNTRPVLRQKIKVRVGEDECKGTSVTTPAPEVPLEKQESARNLEPWYEESLEIIPFFEREEAERELINRYKLIMIDEMNSVINRDNYKHSMHNFLYQEEKVEGELLTRLNLRGTAQLQNCLSDDRFGLKCAYPGTLLAAVPLSHTLTPDAPQGFIVKRHTIRSLVHVVKNNEYLGPIYEAEFLKDAATETQLLLQLSKQCCTDLNLQNGQQCEMEVQFQLNRLWFCEMHKAIDDLTNLDKVLPNLKNSKFCISSQSDTGELNEKQQAAMNFVLGVTDNRCSIPPLLIYGPFGTGKTQTLAKMIQALVQQPQNKILICTHTNSSADLYVKGHFHEYAAVHHEAKPLRIKAKESNPRSTDTITLQYCHLSRDSNQFEFPDKAVLDSTRIIITTTAVARFFHDMKLPENYFSHILIDEASQMLECEALMALGLAGKNTRVVLAGDHMQMGPKLFSVKQDKCSEHTLLNRLFYYYQAENSDGAKRDVIKARGGVPPHPHQHTLQFHHVRGECCLDPTSMSWFNPAQVLSVVDIVQYILEQWPQEWDGKDPESICVLSQGRQVFEIRQRLRQLGLPRFTVENAENVQGKQFRVIVISTVHTKDSLLETDRTCLEFFNDTRVLNTVMTRAQSQIFVVGDVAALSCQQFGTCWRLWRSYIEDCVNKGSAHNVTLDSLKQDLLEISELCRSEDEESSDSESTTSEISDLEDPILQELLDESKDINVPLTEEGLFPVFQHEQFVSSVSNQIAEVEEEQLLTNSIIRKHCELVIEYYDRGYARPLNEPTLRIDIKGRKNIGQAFPGDKVTVEILSETSNPPMGKVINILESADTVKEFVCTIERYDNQVMTPINKCITKIYTPFSKDKPDHVAVRNPENRKVKRFIKINEEARRKYLFVVRVLMWRKTGGIPLGTVVEVFPKITTLDNGLNILNIEYQLRRTFSSSLRSQMQDIQGLNLFDKGRKNFRMLPTFTIDPADSQDLDDAISVRDLGECYEIGVHISDVASFVAKDSELDKYARQLCTTFYPSGKEPIHMFPKELSTNFFSLIPNQDRRAISLIIQVDTKTHCIKESSFWKSVIRSKKKFSYDEAEDIIENPQNSDQLQICLVKAWNFAEVHRRLRKQDDCYYKQPDEDVTLGRRQSHLMVEEMMIMFNHMAAERLLFDETTRSITPLRCQDRPNNEKLTDLFDKNASLIPLSVHFSSQVHECVSHELNNQGLIHRRAMPNPQACISDSETFPILKSVLRCLKTAAEQENIYKIIDFIATDEIHPQLLPFAVAFRRLFHKSCILRSNSTHVSRIGHYDLDLDSYTWASSPIRRYTDVIVQRLLHSVIGKTNVRYTAHDIDLSCMEFSRKNYQQSAYERKSNALRFALQLSTQSERKVAYIVELNASGTNPVIVFSMTFSYVSLVKQQLHNSDLNSITLSTLLHFNKCVAGHLLKLRNQLRPLRVYSNQMEMLEFPYPGCNLKQSRNSKRGEKPNTELSSIALHHLIRKDGNPFSTQILAFDLKIGRGDELTNEEKKFYRETLQKARKHELLRHDVILCTCTAASHPALADALDFKQIIIDECAMATEPEAFIPLVAHKPEQIVLLGDHMQLQPVVHCDVVERLGMSKSLFERYMEKALLLDTQYRMQEDICAFPSKEFYKGKLKTGTSAKPSLFLSKSRKTCIVFGHVEGKEKSLVVRTERGNENSKANVEEAKEVVRIAILLTEAGINRKDIAILTPYNAQVASINELLFEKGIRDITVNTIMRSQGSEWKYVIMSTVRSCPESEIEKQPTKSWIMKQLGFIMDPHQVNVGITRAQEGLCIIGNENLLRCNALWRGLLDHYKEKECVVNPTRNIQVQKATRSLGMKKTARR
ncbi:LOW QUALITY PROTEIN: helicase with zinc finger domain 2-like [Sinocyclocheilus anshuiensis]|uniref:LOW QUALITY PROTEIN: helicase with zinc finger domain 2-like n=1 Tax=Sinocyclocheilus anshuiensis TaxID=1608454 RepID=UPI0007BA2247|nr:PREDICTED: LOW QUALITY PROTEIN: helicase with zinc finger domain 2-like [Sinocyclocheilus anshuiensis]